MVAETRSLKWPGLLVPGLLALLPLMGARPAFGQEGDWNTAKSAVVMISGTLQGSPTTGAGLIVGHAADRLYIVTAQHVVWAEGKAAQDVRVRFFFVPGEEFEARVLTDRDSEQDLAVLAVTGITQKGIAASSIPRAILGRPGQLRRGSLLYPIGYPEGRRWATPIDPDKFDEPNGSVLLFQSLTIRPGHSGGGLFDGCQNLVGMLRLSNPPRAEALAIDGVLRWLRDAGYTVTLQPSPRAPCQEESVPAQPQTCELQINSTPREARVRLNGALRNSTPTQVTLERGKRYDLRIDSEGYEPYEATIDCETGRVAANLEPLTGSITVQYPGDWYGCMLNVVFKIGPKQVRPTQNPFTVSGVPLGEVQYQVSGGITCPMIGFCQASGSGTLVIEDGAVYGIGWQNFAYAQCRVVLIGSDL